jgi:hypothetical protein
MDDFGEIETREEVGSGTGLIECIRCIGIDAVRDCDADTGILRPPIKPADFVVATDSTGICGTAGAVTTWAATFATGGADDILLIGGEVVGWTDGLRIAGGTKLGMVAMGERL